MPRMRVTGQVREQVSSIDDLPGSRMAARAMHMEPRLRLTARLGSARHGTPAFPQINLIRPCDRAAPCTQLRLAWRNSSSPKECWYDVVGLLRRPFFRSFYVLSFTEA
jgi:hypothetical protein